MYHAAVQVSKLRPLLMIDSSGVKSEILKRLTIFYLFSDWLNLPTSERFQQTFATVAVHQTL